MKILIEPSQDRKTIIGELKKRIGSFKGYSGINQEKLEGKIRDDIPLICSISMEFRNRIYDLLKRKPTDKEFLYLVHYIANPLFLDRSDESRILSKLIS